MNCKHIQAQMNQVIDNKLSNHETDKFHSHIANCEDCKLMHAQLIESKHLFGEFARTVPELSAEFELKLEQAIDKKSESELDAISQSKMALQKHSFIHKKPIAMPAIAACFIFFVVSAFYFNLSNPDKVHIAPPEIIVEYTETERDKLDKLFIAHTTPPINDEMQCVDDASKEDCEILKYLISM